MSAPSPIWNNAGRKSEANLHADCVTREARKSKQTGSLYILLAEIESIDNTQVDLNLIVCRLKLLLNEVES